MAVRDDYLLPQLSSFIRRLTIVSVTRVLSVVAEFIICIVKIVQQMNPLASRLFEKAILSETAVSYNFTIDSVCVRNVLSEMKRLLQSGQRSG